MAEMIDYTRMALLASDNILAFHPTSLLSILSDTCWKVLQVTLPCIASMPRYLPRLSVRETPNSLLISSFNWRLTFFKKWTTSLLKLTFCPEALQNLFRQPLFTEACDASPKRIRSSVKNRFDKGGPFFLSKTGFHSSLASASSMIWMSFSIRSTKYIWQERVPLSHTSRG